MLYRNNTQSWLLSILASSIIAYLATGSDNLTAGIVWWLAFVAFSLVRTWNTYHFLRLFKNNAITDFRHWFNIFYMFTFIAAVGWSAGGFIVGYGQDSLSQIYIFIVLIGVSAAAIPLLGVFQSVMLCFQITSTIPYVIFISILLGEQGIILIFMFALYMLAILVAIRRMDVNLSESLSMQYENSRIVNSLSESNQELLYANEKLATLSLEDALTELHNRRYFEMQLELEWKRESREKKILTLIVIDIDYFKLYNDTYGHAAGDDCLKSVAQILKSCLHRPADTIARIGGEEFVILLPTIDTEGALILAQQMQQQLNLADLTHATSPLGDNVTVSIGVASVIPGENVTALGLFKAADKALYKAKVKGRNLVVVGEMEILEP